MCIRDSQRRVHGIQSMKRFAILILCFIALGTIDGAREQTQAQATANAAEGVSKEATLSKEKLVELSKKLQESKGKMKEIKTKLATAKSDEKAVLLKEKAENKNLCLQIEKGIKETKAKLRKLEKQYTEECLKKAEDKATVAKQKIAVLEPQLKKLLSKIKTAKDTLQVAPKASKPALQIKLTKLTAAAAKLDKSLKKAKAILKAAVSESNKAKTAKATASLKGKEKKLNHVNIKIEKLKEKKRAAAIKINNWKKIIKALKPRTPADKAKIKSLKAKIAEAKNKEAMLGTNVSDLKKKAKGLTRRITKIKTKNVKAQSKTECSDLKKKLAVELEKALALKKKFDSECTKAVNSKKDKVIQKAISVKKAIKALNFKINNIKENIVKASGKKKPELKKKVKKLNKILNDRAVKLAKLEKKIKIVTQQCNAAVGQQKKDLEKIKLELLNKIAIIKKEIQEYQKKAVLVKVKIEKSTEEAIKKEKEKSKALMDESEQKMNLAKDEASKLSKALELLTKATALQSQAAKIKIEKLMAKDKETADKIAEQESNILAKIAQCKEEASINKKKAKALRQSLEIRTSQQLEKAQKDAQNKNQMLNKQIFSTRERTESLRKAILEATDASVKEALQNQMAREVAILHAQEQKLNKNDEALKRAKMELEIQKKTAEDLKKEAKLKTLLIQKKFKEKEAQMKKDFDKEKDGKVKETTKKETDDAEKQITEIKQQIRIKKDEFLAFKVALKKAHIQKMASMMESQKVDYERIIKALKKKIVVIEDKIAKYKAAFKEESDKKIKAIIKENEEKLKEKVASLMERIKDEKAKGKAKIQAAERSYKERLSQKKRETDSEIRKLKRDIQKINDDSKAKEDNLNKELSDELKKGDEFKSMADGEDRTQIQDKNELDSYVKQQEKNLKETLKTKAVMTKKQLTAISGKVTKEKARNIKATTTLGVKLKASLSELQKFKKDMAAQKKKYATLVKEFQQYKISSTQKMIDAVATERQKTKEMSDQMKKKIADCTAEVMAMKKDIVKLNADIDNYFEQISTWMDSERKRADAKLKMTQYQEKIDKLGAELSVSRGKVDDVCAEGGDEAACATLQKSISESDIQIGEATKKMEDNSKIYMSQTKFTQQITCCLLYTSPSPRDLSTSRMPSSA
eukprot:TRINITY_DN213_c0_g3_i2.p1 TRINITY_DN213_c0_g3~~TRINITY_DN213_c0_g3_i2.p1  ORF type:complete len:1164 (-),score=558.08 TRINITY_DN213_c0_g3_i2:16-3462(-)